ncbi:MAG: glycosyltransferase [Synergistaceae bacterium]|nr:glycosyltransferase [Synergistaceae bacterium]
MRKIAAVVVTYNRCELLRRNIECLLNQKNAECDIYIIDNASTDSTHEVVLAFHDERVHYFNTGSNLGCSGGFVYGLTRVLNEDYQFIWMMDDDTLPSDTALSQFLDADEKLNGDWGAFSSAAYWLDGSVDNMARQKTGLFHRVSDKAVKSGEFVRLQACTFVSLLVKAEVMRDVGLPIAEYFIWTDDLEYTGRISRKYKLWLVTPSKVTHARQENMRVNFALDSSDRISRYKYIYRNDVHCYRQYGFKGWVYLAVKFAYTALNILLHSKGQKLAKLGVLINGYREGFSFHPEVRRITDGGGGQQNNLLVVAVVRVYRLHDSCGEELGAAA